MKRGHLTSNSEDKEEDEAICPLTLFYDILYPFILGINTRQVSIDMLRVVGIRVRYFSGTMHDL